MIIPSESNFVKIAYKSGQIEGMAKRILILKSMSDAEKKKSLNLIVKWSREIQISNKILLKIQNSLRVKQ